MHTHLWQGIEWWHHRMDDESNQGACKIYVTCNTISVLHQTNDSIIDSMCGEMA